MTDRVWKHVVAGGLALVGAGALLIGSGCQGNQKMGALASCGDGAAPSSAATTADGAVPVDDSSDPVVASVRQAVQNGRQTFRFDTFGSEAFWGDTLGLHKAIAGSANGGVGPGLSPKAAGMLGLKVDVAAVPLEVALQAQTGQLNLDDPATTLALLKLDAVIGVKASFDANGVIQSVGIRCSLCHATVDDSFAPGIGKRLDGWANRDLNVGAIIALAPNVSPFTDLLKVDAATVRSVLNGWGPGRFDAALLLDGKAMRPDGKTAATLIPPAFGLAGVSLHTWTGWGSVTHWNALVSNLEMMGKGTFYDPRLDDASKFPIAATAKRGHVKNDPDLITSKLADLHVYQLALKAPAPKAGSFDATAAARGKTLFSAKAKCAGCHVPPIFSEPGWPMHTAEEIGIDDFQAKRSPDGRYRTAPLGGLHTHMKGGFYHDGRFATLNDVINHYDTLMSLGLTDAEKTDLSEYLKSL